jgi:hypothetical protein
MRFALHIILVIGAAVTLNVGTALAKGPLPVPVIPDYQLGGSYPPPKGVNVLARDSTEEPVAGLFNICYVNGFQSQPDSNLPLKLVVKKANGKPLFDPDWPDEFLLDISTAELREQNFALIKPVIDGCAKKGFSAVEFDNLDSYTRSDGQLKKSDAIKFAKMLVNAAKQNGLHAGQKNLSELGTQGRDDIGFTFVIAEECHRWDECKAYTNIYGDQVINIEYDDDLRGTFKDICKDKNTPKATILRDRLLSKAGAKRYKYKAC